MRHPTGRPFLYFILAGVLLVAGIPLFPLLHASTETLQGLMIAWALCVFAPFIFLPQLVFQLERHWIRRGSLREALKATSWAGAMALAGAATVVCLAWIGMPWLVAYRAGPPRLMTAEEERQATETIAAWNRGKPGDLTAVLSQLTWKWLPNAAVSAALSRRVREECPASDQFESCFQGLRALFATGAQTPDLATTLVSLSRRDPEVRANWRSTGHLLERGEIAHRYRSMLLDMLGLLGPPAADAAVPELAARLSDPEERSRWAAAGALRRLDPAGTRPEARRFFATNVIPLIGSYHVDRKRRLRACLFLFRAEVRGPAVQALAFDALGDDEPYVRSCGAFLVLTSGVEAAAAEETLLGAFEAYPNQFARDSIVAALAVLGTPQAQRLVSAYTPWQPERLQKIKERWHDPYFRLFGDLF